MNPVLQPSRRLSSRPWAFTLVEALVVTVVLAILAGVAAVSYIGVKRSEADKAGYPILGAAQVDARRVAATEGQSFPAQVRLLEKMANSAAAADGRGLAYFEAPSPDTSKVSVRRGDSRTLGMAVMTSMAGSWEDGTASDGHCLMALDSLTQGTRYAQMDDAIRGGVNYCGAQFIIACDADLKDQTGAGTVADPYRLSSSTTCSGGTEAPPLPPSCVLAETVPATDGVSTRSARVTWVPAPGAGEGTYTVTATGPSTVTVTGIDASARSAVVEGLNPGATYTFTVTALSPSGARSADVASNDLLMVPGTPALSVTATSSSMAVAWAPTAGAQSYTLTRTPAFSTDPAPFTAANAVAGVIRYTDTDVEAGKSYQYAVTATGTQPESTRCSVPVTGGGAVKSSSYTADLPLQAPAIAVVNAASGLSGFDVTWAPVAGAKSYQVRRTPAAAAPATAPTSGAGAFTVTLDATGVDLDSPALTDGPLVPTGADRWYTYQVAGVSPKGDVGAWSAVDFGLLAPNKPTPTVAQDTTTPESALTVTWPAVPGATKYDLLRNGKLIKAGATSGYRDTGLDSGTEYAYTVVASNEQTRSGKAVGGRTPSDEVRNSTAARVGDVTVTADNTTRRFTASWEQAADATSYTLEASSNGSAWSTVMTGGGTVANGRVSFTEPTAYATGTVRAYRLTIATAGGPRYAKAVAAVLAPAPATVNITTARGTGALGIVASSAGATEVTIVDDQNRPVVTTAGATASATRTAALGTWVRYGATARVTRTLSVPAWNGFSAATLTATSDTTKGLKATSPTCVGGTGGGAPVATSATTIGCWMHTAGTTWASAVTPTSITAATGTKTVSLSWKGVQAVTAYRLYRTNGAGDPGTDPARLLKTVSATGGANVTYVDTAVALGTQYSYVVEPVLPTGVSGAGSSSRTALTVPAAPTMSLTGLARDAISVTFGQVTPATTTGYIVVPAGTDPSAFDTAKDALKGKVVYWGGPARGKQVMAIPAGANVTVTASGLALETSWAFEVYAVNGSGRSDKAADARCTAPNAPAAPTQDMNARAKFGNQITMLAKTRQSPCISELVVARTVSGKPNLAKTETVSVVSDGTTRSYTATPVAARTPYTFTVAFKGQGGVSPSVTAKGSALSAYDIVIRSDNPDLYYPFDEAPGRSTVYNCANSDCDDQSSADARYNLKVSSKVSRPASPMSGSGFDPENNSVKFTNAGKIAATEDNYAWPGTDYTMESWVYLTSAKQTGVIVGWGAQNCQTGRTAVGCNGGFMALGGKGESASSDQDYFGWSAGVWGNALVGANYFKDTRWGGSRLDPKEGESASVALTANQWHLLHFTVDTSDNTGRTYVRHYVDGRALNDCYTSKGDLKWGTQSSDDYQWCTVWNRPTFNTSTDLFKAHPSLKGVSVGGFNRIAPNGNTENRFAQAQVDAVAVYRRVLSTQEMRTHWLAGSKLFNATDDEAAACVLAAGCYIIDAKVAPIYSGRVVTASLLTFSITGKLESSDGKSANRPWVLQAQDADGVWQRVDTGIPSTATATDGTERRVSVRVEQGSLRGMRLQVETPFGYIYRSL